MRWKGAIKNRNIFSTIILVV